MKHYLDLVSISNKVHRRQRRMKPGIKLEIGIVKSQLLTKKHPNILLPALK